MKRFVRIVDSGEIDEGRYPVRGGVPRSGWHELGREVRPCKCGVSLVMDRRVNHGEGGTFLTARVDVRLWDLD